MDDPDRTNSAEIARENIKSLYAKLGQPWCENLHDFVAFNSVGFRHLIEKKGIFRSKQDQKRRFALLAHASEMLKNPKIIPIHQPKETIHRTRHQGKTSFESVPTDYWIFQTIIGERGIKLIVRQFEKGQKHFLTIYDYDSKEKPLP